MMATALIVEDHPDQAGLVARILRMRDFEPIVAEDGGDRPAAGPRSTSPTWCSWT